MQGQIQVFSEGVQIMKELEMSRRSRPGDAEGVAGEECESGESVRGV